MVRLLDETIAAHGGLERWRALDELRLGVDSGGPAFRLKGQPRAMRGAVATIRTSGQQIVWEPFPEPGSRGVFSGADARIESPNGAVQARTDRPHGTRWQPVDMLAFAGAALWSYISFPFAFVQDGFDVRELPRRRLAITVHPPWVTHSRQHVLWIGDDGLITRHDYTAAAISRFATGANLCLEHSTISGLQIATRRRVVPRAGSQALPGPTVVWIHVQPAA